MDIVIIGSGNVAAVLGRKLLAAGHRIVQIVSRNATAASELAYEWDTESANYKSLINKNADIYLVAVSDNSISEVIADVQLPGKIVAHTAASVSKEVLKEVSEYYGVFYPLQSLRKEVRDLPDIPIFVDGNDAYTKQKLASLAFSISLQPAEFINDDLRLKLHLAAVIVNNFTNHLYVLAEQYCKREGIDFRQLLPLINETGHRLEIMNAGASQTGPAIRHDSETISKHLNLLAAHPQLQKMYKFFSDSIESTAPDKSF